MKVSWKIGGLYKAEAEKVYSELSGIKCTPVSIVDYAKSENTELHKCFEWNDSIAGHKYRCIQAQGVVRNLVVVKEESEEKTPLRLFYNTGDRTGEYKPVKMIMKNEDEYESLLKKAQDELRAFKKKYSFLTELEEILELIK